jgi:uncharacterized Zn-finger protein
MASHLDVNSIQYPHAGLAEMNSFNSNSYYPSVTNGQYQNMVQAGAFNAGYAHHQSPQALHSQGLIAPRHPIVREARNAIPRAYAPAIKVENGSVPPTPNAFYPSQGSSHSVKAMSPSSPGSDLNFATDVDTLMKTIQLKQTNATGNRKPVTQQPLPDINQMRSAQYSNPFGAGYLNALPQIAPNPRAEFEAEEQQKPKASGSQRSKKRYECEFEGCNKSFFQKTHLEIHTRAHTGDKPFLCKDPSCGQRFSQLGNLKTHERRHTGEKPYSCDICGKKFAQRGNVRAHKIVHDQLKPFTCRLEDCNKQFTQLGNLKSHQNKFHSDTLRNLTQRFASFREGDAVSAQDKELWEYFADLYKNSNKGIKGRGKDRKVSGTQRARNEEGEVGGGSASASDDRSAQMSLSPSSNADGYDLGSAEMDDESSVGSPFDAVTQQQLPPMRGSDRRGGQVNGYNIDAEYGAPDNMAHYSMERKMY